MNVADLGGLAEDEEIVVAAHLAIPGIEARAAIAFLVEAERLDHGAHGAVEHQDALGCEAAQRLLGARHGHRHGRLGRHPAPLAPTLSPMGRGSTPCSRLASWLARRPSRRHTPKTKAAR